MHDTIALRNRLLDRFTDTKVDEETGHVIWRKKVFKRVEKNVVTTIRDVDATTLFTPGDRHTDDLFILRYEAELAQDEPHKNYARPLTEQTERTARERIEADGLVPAWEVVDG